MNGMKHAMRPSKPWKAFWWKRLCWNCSTLTKILISTLMPLTLQLGSLSARWKANGIWKQKVEWDGAKVANRWKGNVGRNTLFQDLEPLHRLQRCGGVDRQCCLEILCHSTKVVIKVSEMARHISLVQCGHSTQAWEGKCGARCVKSQTPI